MQPTTTLLSRSAGSIRRLRLTTKMVNGGYYKGNRSGAMGRHTKYGTYIIEWDKVRHYVVPDLTNFELTPFVAKRMKPTRGKYGEGEHPVMGQVFLDRWKAENGAS